jgi:hypothetical protein
MSALESNDLAERCGGWTGLSPIITWVREVKVGETLIVEEAVSA